MNHMNAVTALKAFRQDEMYGFSQAMLLVDEASFDMFTPAESAEEEFFAEASESLDVRSREGHLLVHRWLAEYRENWFEGGPGHRDKMTKALSRAEKFIMTESGFFRKHGFKLGEAWMLLAHVEVQFERLQLQHARPQEYTDLVRASLEAKHAATVAGDKKAEAYALLVAAKATRVQETTSTGVWRTGHENTKTFKTLEKAIEIFTECGDKRMAAKARYFLGDALITKGVFQDGMLALRDAHEIFRDEDCPREEAVTILTMAIHFLVFVKTKEALIYAEDALQSLIDLDETVYPSAQHLVAPAVAVLCKSYSTRLDVNSAQKSAAEWLDLFREKDDQRALTIGLIALADAYECYAEMDEATIVLEETVACAEELEDPRLVADALRRFCQHKIECGKLEDAEPLARQSIDAALEAHDKLREAKGWEVLNNIYAKKVFGEIGEKKGELLVEFQRGLQEQRQVLQELGDPSQEAHTLVFEAKTWVDHSVIEYAMDLLNAAKVMFQKAQDKQGECRALCSLAELQSLSARIRKEGSMEREDLFAQAQNTVDAVRVAAKDSGDELTEARVFGTMCEVSLNGEKVEQAAQHAKEALRLAKSCGEPEEYFKYIFLLIDVMSMKLTAFRSGPHGRMMDKLTLDALAIARTMRKKVHIVSAILRRVHVLSYYSQLDDAVTLAVEAVQLADEIPNYGLKGRAMSYLAWVHCCGERNQEAQECVVKTCEVIQDIKFDLNAEMAKHNCIRVLETIEVDPEEFEVDNEIPEGLLTAEIYRDWQTAAEEEDEDMDEEDEAEGVQKKPRRRQGPPKERPKDDWLTQWERNLGVGVSREDQARAAKPTRGVSERRLEDEILNMARITLGAQDLLLDSPLQESGMDSLSAVSFRNGVQQQLGIKVAPELIEEFPTARLVANHVKSKLGTS